MQKTLSLPLSVLPSPRWLLLAGEAAFFFWLVFSDGAPAGALAALRLFLRF